MKGLQIVLIFITIATYFWLNWKMIDGIDRKDDE